MTAHVTHMSAQCELQCGLVTRTVQPYTVPDTVRPEQPHCVASLSHGTSPRRGKSMATGGVLNLAAAVPVSNPRGI